jgi:hypothetical protein
MLEIEEVTPKNGHIGQGQSKPNVHGAKDENLVWRVAQKDEEALSELYDRYGGLIYAMRKKWLGDSSLAEHNQRCSTHETTGQCDVLLCGHRRFSSCQLAFTPTCRRHEHDATGRTQAHRPEAYSPECLEGEFYEV